jgi:hypothetical protein
VKKLNQKKTVDFTTVTIGRSMRRKSEDISEGLEEHVAERHALPRKDPTDTLIEESVQV